MKRTQVRRQETRRPTGMALQLQQAWRSEGERVAAGKPAPSTPKPG
ncbi:MAG TPA: hypothetical protein VMT90_06820 [Dehalococcoidia bacterium]|nr:hypothetical protein [Dehalococcoidia bacterium]